MPIYNLIEYSDNYSDTSGSLWQCKREESLVNNGDLDNVSTANSTASFFKSLTDDDIGVSAKIFE